ncbi:MAG: nitroreductase [Flavobacteriaceae bacterium]
MDIYEAVESRVSCRAFRPESVPEAMVRRILAAASRAPSGGNLQPWIVHVLTGAPLAELKARIARHYDTLPKGEGTEYAIYPEPLGETYHARRKENGAQLYELLGIAREDRAARLNQFERNFRFFDAPVGMLFFIDRQMQPGQWSDLGMFIQTVMLLARAEGLHSCAQEAWAMFHRSVAEFVAQPPELMLFCGLALGYMDEGAIVNELRTTRAPLDDFARFSGF